MSIVSLAKHDHVLLSSHQAGWDKLHLEYEREPARDIPEFCFAHHIVIVPLEPFEAKLMLDGHWQNEVYSSGDIIIFPAHQSSPRFQCNCHTIDIITLHIEPTLLTQSAFELIDAERAELLPQSKIQDPLIQQIGLALLAELRVGETDSQFYAESMATALSMHLLRRYSSLQKQKIKDYVGGLPKYRLREVLAYISEHLDQSLSLTQLAAVVQMSPHYFASLFKQSTGFTPHQYVAQCRIDRAKQLLLRQELSLVEIYQQVGFQSQSHFTRVFRHYTGTTPKAYRDRI